MKNTYKHIALHHTAVEGNNRQLAGVNRYHKDKWGMKSSIGWYVGYNYFCEKDGTITQTRSHNEETVANKGHNCDVQERCNTISFCMAGNFDKEHPTDKQTKAFREFVHNLKQRYFMIKVVGHRDIQINRLCPGNNITQQYFDKANAGLDEDVMKAERIALLSKKIELLKRLVVKLQQLLSLKKWV